VFPGGLAYHSIAEPANASNPPVTGGNKITSARARPLAALLQVLLALVSLIGGRGMFG
jgi:hypothetical protein